MTVMVRIVITGEVSAMAQAETAVEAIRNKAKQSTIDWNVEAIYTE